MRFADRLIREAKVAVIPLSPFYARPPSMTLVRLCIAKRDETLCTAAERLRAFADGASAR
jgi:aspartate/methionine/tyrosine aminotransferase